MFDEISVAEKSVREVLASLRTERVISERGMSTGVQASSSRGVAASPSISWEERRELSIDMTKPTLG
jgi:hypothetical protein